MKLPHYQLFIIGILFVFFKGNAKEGYSQPLVGNEPFITTWKTDNYGLSDDNQVTIPTFFGEIYNYTVDWGDGNTDTNVTGDITHTYSIAGTYEVSISGNFPRIYFNATGDKGKLLKINKWGDNVWTSMENAFDDCWYLDVIANDIPNLSNVQSTAYMFRDCRILEGTEEFNNWDTSNINNMAGMFIRTDIFNSTIGEWNVENVDSMYSMFLQTNSFNQNLNLWNVSNVKNMESMFAHSSFDSDISNWNVGKVTTLDGMFFNSSFNQDISTWDVSNVIDMNSMFGLADSFNQDISNWDVRKVQNMSSMFVKAKSFDKNLNKWQPLSLIDANHMFNESGLSTKNYDALLLAWSQLNLKSNVDFDANDTYYCKAEEARTIIMDKFGWLMADSGLDCPQKPFITTWKTDNPGTSADNQITIPTFLGETYNYNVDWGDGTLDTNVTGDITHTYSIAGTYEVSITGDFPHIFFRDMGDKEKILTVEQWGDIKWKSMNGAFSGCTNLDVLATDSPNLSEVTSLASMFRGCESLIGTPEFNKWNLSTITSILGLFENCNKFNQPLANWDVSKVQNFEVAFRGASTFNQPLNNWDVGNVVDLTGTFWGAVSFNQPLDKWNVSNVEELWATFLGATSFNQDIGSWATGKVVITSEMFREAISFDQDISAWDISNLRDASWMFKDAGLSTTNYDNLLIGWSAQDVQTQLYPFGAGYSTYCTGEEARNNLIENHGWKINDAGFAGITIDELEEQERTDSYTLPAIKGTNLTGNQMYYTGPTGTGQSFAAGATLYATDFPDYPVTLYIYDFRGDSYSGCTDEKSFELILNTICKNPVADNLEDALSCTSYTLPELSENNFYYTETSANGERFEGGDIIYSSKTLYIHTGWDDCYDENSFKITINRNLCDIEIKTIDPCMVEFPQFITPNGDGRFDSFKATKNPCSQSGKLSILDRRGRVIFKTNDLNTGWDGNEDSRKLPETDYWYLFQNSDSGKTFTGHFTILR
ncbi:BspA family leucine-rich repeat surface protein [Zobellia roscoffensis]|uniref:BspA family leucine-rich repeat surface protein n=1 Tax=Zobellia roscoffensis TaxID=2779508 RepID=UPI00188D2B7E|nr:BspA family leucine-rich repeat surface protein [Zobellia roscoffensis]